MRSNSYYKTRRRQREKRAEIFLRELQRLESGGQTREEAIETIRQRIAANEKAAKQP